MINIGVIEADVALRQELKNLINIQPEMVCTIAAGSVDEFLQKVTAECPVLIVLLAVQAADTGKSVYSRIKTLKNKITDSDVVVLSNQDNTDIIVGALRAGALGYLLKDTPFPEMKEALLGVAAGGAFLSPAIARKVADYFLDLSYEEDYELTNREKQIITCLTEGLSYKIIASRLFLSVDTVRFHLRNIYKKLQVNSKTEVIAKVLRKELLLD